MSTDPDVTRIVRSWLEMGATALPDRVLDQVLDQVTATPQRRAWWPARRLNEMNTPLKLAIASAALAVVVVAAIGITVMPGAGGVGGSPAVLPPTAVPTPRPTPTAVPPTPTSSATVAPTAAPTTSPAAVDRGWPNTRDNPVGRYSWAPTAGGRSAFWMHNIHSHLAITISARPVDASEPGLMGVTVAGFDGTYQEYLVNSEDVLERHVWIVDIDGTPVTISLETGHDVSAAGLAEGMAVIDSIDVERTTSKLGFKLTFDLLAGWDSG